MNELADFPTIETAPMPVATQPAAPEPGTLKATALASFVAIRSPPQGRAAVSRHRQGRDGGRDGQALAGACSMKGRVRIGQAGYAACLKTIAFGGGQATWKTVAEANSLSRQTARDFCHALNDLRVIHIAGWERTGQDNRSRVAAYAIGDEPDAPYPGTARRPRKSHRTGSVEIITFANAIKALQSDHHHGVSLSDATGLYPRAARNLLRALHQAKLVYVAEYQDRKSAGCGAAMYAFGVNQRDTKKPAPIPQVELNRRWNEVKKRLRADTKLMRGLVTGANGDRRTSPYRRQPEAAGATP